MSQCFWPYRTVPSAKMLVVAKACPSSPHPTHADQAREPQRVKVGWGVLPVPPFGSPSATGREGGRQEPEAGRVGPRATEHRNAGGQENSLRLRWLVPWAQPGTACALSFHLHCRLLSAIHNEKVNSYTAQLGIHKNTHQSAKKKKLSKFLGLFLDLGWPIEQP